MSQGALFVWTLVCALGAGTVAGVFFAFSTFVMKGLARLPPAQGILAMQSINVTAVTAPFMGLFFGTAVASLVVAVGSWESPGARYLLSGCVLYVLGVVGVTVAFNVPRNNALAALVATQADAAGPWARYLSEWTAWNHVRTVAALGAAAAFILALRG